MSPDQTTDCQLPLFLSSHQVDDGRTTYKVIGDTIAEAFDIQCFFLGDDASQAAGVRLTTLALALRQISTILTRNPFMFLQEDLNETAQEVNNDHAEAWQELIENSDPPVPRTPLSSYIELHKFERRAISMTNDKIKKVLGFELKHPKFTAAEVQSIVDSFIEEGSWPE